MRDRRLGTRAALAAILETLLQRGNAEREGKVLVATDRGVELIRVVDDRVKIPSMRGEWEYALERIYLASAGSQPPKSTRRMASMPSAYGDHRERFGVARPMVNEGRNGAWTVAKTRAVTGRETL